MSDWYEYPTNYSTNQSVDGPFDFFMGYPSYILGDYYSYGVVLLIWVVSFSLSLVSGTRGALMVSGFISSIFATYFVWIGIMNPLVPILLVLVTIIGAIGAKQSPGL